MEIELSNLLKIFLEAGSVSTDTRKLKQGDIFFALHGPRFDGNAYAHNALEKGASYVVVDKKDVVEKNDPRYIYVSNTLETLQALASAYRDRFSIPVIGITGSNGKTTTKELIHAVLATEKRVHYTKGNLNNHIGVPLTLLAMPRDTEIAIVEMGANQPGDIAELSAIAKPTHGLITNIGQAHLERLGSIEGVKQTKGELFEFIRATKGHIFLNAGDERLCELPVEQDMTVTYGSDDADFRGELISNSLLGMSVQIHAKQWEDGVIFHSNLSGIYNAQNLLAAVAVGATFQIGTDNMQKGIAAYYSTNNRSQLLEKGGFKIWLDAYNANPSSMMASIKHVMETNADSRIALILGDMLELGNVSEQSHKDLGKYIQGFDPELVIGVGEEMKHMVDAFEGNKAWYPGLASFEPEIISKLDSANVILIKGSRGMALEKLIDHLAEK